MQNGTVHKIEILATCGNRWYLCIDEVRIECKQTNFPNNSTNMKAINNVIPNTLYCLTYNMRK